VSIIAAVAARKQLGQKGKGGCLHAILLLSAVRYEFQTRDCLPGTIGS
jgi:hypothetical protein